MYYSCTFQYVHINLYLIYAYRVRNNASFIIVNPITMDSIIFAAGFVHSACTSASVVSGVTRLDSM
jgi:hypothetical protein